jgi:hypothetical protein
MDENPTADTDTRSRDKNLDQLALARAEYGRCPEGPRFKGLDSLAQCLRRYVDTNPSRFAVKEENVDAGRVLIVVLRKDGIEDEDRVLWEI